MPIPTLRVAGLIAVVIGAAVSVGFLLHAGHPPSIFLIVAMTIWVLSPFGLLLAADAMSARWSALARATLSWTMVVLPLCSLAVYGFDFAHPLKAQRAFAFVMLPPVSWLAIAVAITSAARISSKRAHRTHSGGSRSATN